VGKLLVRFCEGRGSNQVMVHVTPSQKAPRLLDPAGPDKHSSHETKTQLRKSQGQVNYIHANPVRARLVPSAKDYKWSSFRAFYLNSGEPLAVDHDWWWPDDSEKLSRAVKKLGCTNFWEKIGGK